MAVDQIIRSDGSTEKVSKSPYQKDVSGYGFAEKSLVIKSQFNASKDKPLVLNELPASYDSVSENTENRKSITFILGTDKPTTNQFYAAADALYRTNEVHKTDFVINHLRNISQVKTYLASHADPLKPWGVVNVVSHSSPWSGFSNTTAEGGHQSMNLFSLYELISEPNFSPLSDAVIDGLTEIRLMGCALGWQKNMLKAMSVFMGGQDFQRPIVKAPIKHVYLNQNDRINAGDIYSYSIPWFISSSPDYNQVDSVNYGIDVDQWNSQPIEISFRIAKDEWVGEVDLDDMLSQQVLLDMFLSDLNVGKDEFTWALNSVSESEVELVGKAFLIMTEFSAVQGNQLDVIDFSDSKMVSAVK